MSKHLSSSVLRHNEGYEFRSVTKEELPELTKLMQYVFGDPEGRDQPDDDALLPEFTTCVFQKGRLVASSGGFPFKMQLNGKGMQVDGVTAVGTMPDHRRRGLVRQLITQRLHLCYEQEKPAAILWASMGAIYQRFGYGLASQHFFYTVNPRLNQYQFQKESTGRVEFVPVKEAVPQMKEIYREFLEPRTLQIYRTKVNWDIRSNPKNKNNFVAIHYDHNDTADGYINYSLGPYKPPKHKVTNDQVLRIRELIHLNDAAYRGLFDYVRAHDLAEEIHFGGAIDDIAPNLMLEPRELNIRSFDGIWLRVVDVAKILEQRGYQGSGKLSFTIHKDPECEWNVGTYDLEVADGEAKVTKRAGKSDFSISIQGFASLVSGQYGLNQLVQAGRAQLHSKNVWLTANSIFSTQFAPYCLESF